MFSGPHTGGLRRAGIHGIAVATELRRFGDAPALHHDGRTTTYRELAERVEARAGELGGPRRLVLLTGTNGVELVVTHLAALAGGHAVLLHGGANAEHTAVLLDTYRPDVHVVATGGACTIDERARGTTHELHPDLALLLSTSGSTGAPKLVRLSHDNVASNAAAIASYLALRDDDCAPTSLPLTYCYGLSVLHSHLAVGASVVVTDRSVVDPCFWRAVDEHRCTSLAGVPRTFELIELSGADRLAAPSLRRVTQAGGRMAPERVRRLAQLGRRHGWDLFVMYGQTEATARMAYLPPALAERRPEAVGVPIPGGSFELRACPEASEGCGEVVYRGPNVMLGYAAGAGDLALGRTVDELATGDLGRVGDDGLLEIVGRRSRFLKVSGVRIDLDHLERSLAAAGMHALCTGTDERLVVAVEGAATDGCRARAAVAAASGIPPRSFDLHLVDELPRLPNGKPDHAAVRAMGAGGSAGPGAPWRGGAAAVLALAAEVLDRPDAGPEDTFVSLGGDSFSYVEMSVRLEELLGSLPRDWHVTPLGELTTAARPAVRRGARAVARTETSVVLRAVAMVLVVGTHMGVYHLRGGAHLLLAVAGANVARFQLGARHPSRTRHALRSVARVAVPTSAWIGLQMAVVGGYSLGSLLLVNNYTGSSWRRDGRWQYWYLEALVQVMLVLAAAFAIPAVRRAERRYPFALPLALLVPALALRFEVVRWGDPYNALFRPHTIVWLFLLGWAIQRAHGAWRRLAVTAVALVSVPGFFDEPGRERVVLAGLLLLAWVPEVPVPRPLPRVLGALASASLATYLVHWQVWPVMLGWFQPWPALAATLAAGVGAWWCATATVRLVARAAAGVRARRGGARSQVPGGGARWRGSVPSW